MDGSGPSSFGKGRFNLLDQFFYGIIGGFCARFELALARAGGPGHPHNSAEAGLICLRCGLILHRIKAHKIKLDKIKLDKIKSDKIKSGGAHGQAHLRQSPAQRGFRIKGGLQGQGREAQPCGHGSHQGKSRAAGQLGHEIHLPSLLPHVTPVAGQAL